jgi:predicted dehydrogenase
MSHKPNNPKSNDLKENSNANSKNAKTSNTAGNAGSAVLKPLKVAVIGAGVMGQHHLRICHQLKEVELLAVVDVNQERAKEMAAHYGIVACSSMAELHEKLPQQVEAAIIAVPSILHLEIGRQCLSQNIHCLIEKPLAVSEGECIELIELAEKNNLILLVGHVERFNAAVQQLAKELNNKRQIKAIDAQRLNLNQQRLIDVDVIMDLMTHDLDIILSLINQPLHDYSIRTICQADEDEADFATALLSFEGGAVANVTASRITPKKTRKIDVTTDGGFYSLDFLTQEIWLHRDVNYVEQIAVNKQDALTAEILNFVHSIQSGVALGVTGQEALKILKLVWQLQEKGRSIKKAVSLQVQQSKYQITNY